MFSHWNKTYFAHTGYKQHPTFGGFSYAVFLPNIGFSVFLSTCFFPLAEVLYTDGSELMHLCFSMNTIVSLMNWGAWAQISYKKKHKTCANRENQLILNPRFGDNRNIHAIFTLNTKLKDFQHIKKMTCHGTLYVLLNFYYINFNKQIWC